jgi:hypothetical protein
MKKTFLLFLTFGTLSLFANNEVLVSCSSSEDENIYIQKRSDETKIISAYIDGSIIGSTMKVIEDNDDLIIEESISGYKRLKLAVNKKSKLGQAVVWGKVRSVHCPVLKHEKL